MRNRDIKGQKVVCVGVEFLAFNVLLHTKFKQKLIWAQIIFKNLFKTGFSICVGRVWIVIRYFLFERQTFNGLLKVIGIQISIMNKNIQFLQKIMLRRINWSNFDCLCNFISFLAYLGIQKENQVQFSLIRSKSTSL